MTNASVLGHVLERGRHLLSSQTQQTNNPKVLIVLDENSQDDLPFISHTFPQASILTNRWDILTACQKAGLNCIFNDFEFDALTDASANAPANTPADSAAGFDLTCYRISKERAVSHHILNHLFSLTSIDGHLVIGGRKNEGIKSYFDKSKKTFSCHAEIQKLKDLYIATFRKTDNQANHQQQTLNARLDDKNYSQKRDLAIGYAFESGTAPHSDPLICTTKPGAYGWNKVDQGSQFLIQTIFEQNCFTLSTNSTCTKLLDLGCGIGYLSIQAILAYRAKDIPFPTTLIATDNNAAAIECTKDNLNKFAPSHTKVKVLADDCAANISETFDLILCNPPFHQGFDISRDLSLKFIASTKRLLNQHGHAYFVVNSFIPVEAMAKELLLNVHTLANNRQFKAIKLTLQ